MIAMVHLYFIFLISTKCVIISCKNQYASTDIVLSTSKSISTAKIQSTCHVDQTVLVSNKINVIPFKKNYNQMDRIIYSCQSGYYLQRPNSNNGLIIYENTCINGTWKTAINSIPVCRSSCQQWDDRSKSWHSINLNVTNDNFGYILSPGYPGKIEYFTTNCSYRIYSKNGYIKLVAVDLNIQSFFLEITSENYLLNWPNDSLINNSYSFYGYKSIIINLKLKHVRQINNGKTENFKLLYRSIGSFCKSQNYDDNLIIKTIAMPDHQYAETYSCQYPYNLIGPSERRCALNSWTTLVLPKCKFQCSSINKIYVKKIIETKVSFEEISNCKLRIVSNDNIEIINININRLGKLINTPCLYIEIENNQRICMKNKIADFYLISSGSITILKSENIYPESFKLTFKSIPSRKCSYPPSVENGYVKYYGLSINSIATISCKDNHFLKGSLEIKCQLDYSGVTRWESYNKPECVKLCSEDWMNIEVTKIPFFITIPEFFNLKYSENQLCRWKIRPADSPQIITITTMRNIKDFVNLSIENGKNEFEHFDISQNMKNVTDFIFICMLTNCHFSMIPLKSFNKLHKKIFIEIKIVLADDVTAVHYHPGIFYFILFMATMCFIMALIYYDYSHHPYTGYTAKFFIFLKPSKIKKLSAISKFDTTPMSKTEADIIVYYKEHHSSEAYVDFCRSSSFSDKCISHPSTWKYKLDFAKRRFSDITDMVISNCTAKIENVTKLHTDSIKTGSENLVYECDDSEII